MNIKENDSIQYDLSEAKPKNYTEKESKETCMFHADSGNKLFFTFSIMNILCFYNVKNKSI